MTQFTEWQPSLENYRRSIMQFGRNVESYKFALGKSLLDLAEQGSEVVTLEQSAVPFARNSCEHLRIADIHHQLRIDHGVAEDRHAAELFPVANFPATRQLTHNAESNRPRLFAFYASSGKDLRRRFDAREFSENRTRTPLRLFPAATPARTLALSV